MFYSPKVTYFFGGTFLLLFVYGVASAPPPKATLSQAASRSNEYAECYKRCQLNPQKSGRISKRTNSRRPFQRDSALRNIKSFISRSNASDPAFRNNERGYDVTWDKDHWQNKFQNLEWNWDKNYHITIGDKDKPYEITWDKEYWRNKFKNWEWSWDRKHQIWEELKDWNNIELKWDKDHWKKKFQNYEWKWEKKPHKGDTTVVIMCDFDKWSKPEIEWNWLTKDEWGALKQNFMQELFKKLPSINVDKWSKPEFQWNWHVNEELDALKQTLIDQLFKKLPSISIDKDALFSDKWTKPEVQWNWNLGSKFHDLKNDLVNTVVNKIPRIDIEKDFTVINGIEFPSYSLGKETSKTIMNMAKYLPLLRSSNIQDRADTLDDSNWVNSISRGAKSVFDASWNVIRTTGNAFTSGLSQLIDPKNNIFKKTVNEALSTKAQNGTRTNSRFGLYFGR